VSLQIVLQIIALFVLLVGYIIYLYPKMIGLDKLISSYD